MKFRYLNRFEKIVVIFLSITFFVSLGGIINNYISSVSSSVPSEGGVYAEGVVGSIQFLNPVFSSLNPVDNDISSLIFSGLMRYNPETDQIEDDIATHTLDISKKVYTFTLRDNVYWHDGTPVTADDIMYTFQEVIQNVDFKNSLLRENFQGVEVKKVSDFVVTFSLEKPYKFFLTNLTIGLLPKHILSSIPVENLHLSEFNYMNPVGTGPYKFVNVVQVNGANKVSLEKNESFYRDAPYLHEVDFYVFPSFEALESSKNILDGIQSLSKQEKLGVENNSQFHVYSYTLPQYVSAFFNTESPILSDKKVRLGLSLGVNKESLLLDLKEKTQIDTPFLELDTSSWLLQYDKVKAQGALNDAGWKLPWKQEVEEVPLEEKKEEADVIDADFIYSPSADAKYATTEKEFFIEGNVKEEVTSVYVNGYKLSLFSPEKGSFSYKASSNIGTLKEGENIYTIEVDTESQTKEFLDSITIFYSSDAEIVQQKMEEYRVEKDQLKTPDNQEENEEVLEIINENKDDYRINTQAEILSISILTPKKPKEYEDIAKNLQKQWKEIGVQANIESLEIQELQERVAVRDYDILIFGQSLGYNLDSYPYWHSSQAKEGFNFSQLKSFKIDTLLEEIRSTHDEEKRQKRLGELEEALIEEMPAVFIYIPERYFALSPRVKGAEFTNLRDARDRLANISSWYVNEKRSLSKSSNVIGFFTWFFEDIKKDLSF